MESKVCFRCPGRGLQPLTNFYAHPRMLDGHLGKCKDCTKADSKKREDELRKDPLFIESERTRGREKYRRLYVGLYKTNPEGTRKWKIKFPEKAKATTMSANLKKPFTNAEKHHWSYNDEHFKDVIWLTKKNHMKAHRFLVYDQERKMYRRYDTNILLDTKEGHDTFIRECIDNKPD